MSDHIHKNHNKSLLLYHLVCPIKYRRSILSSWVEESLVAVCRDISRRYEIHFIEIGANDNDMKRNKNLKEMLDGVFWLIIK